MRTALLFVCLIGLVQLGVVQGQAVVPYPYPGPYDYGYHASTVEEGVARGLADVIRSAGAANLMHSEAAKNYEDARRKYIDNRVYGTQKYFEMRAINRQARAAERGPRPTQEDLIRYSKERLPKPLSVTELDPLTGTIRWPTILRQEMYQRERQRVEQLYAERAANGYLSAEQLIELDKLTKQLHSRLKANLKKYPPQLYVESMRFLKSLAAEPYMRRG